MIQPKTANILESGCGQNGKDYKVFGKKQFCFIYCNRLPAEFYLLLCPERELMEMVGKMMPLHNELTNNMINMKKQNNMRITLQGFGTNLNSFIYCTGWQQASTYVFPQKGIDGNGRQNYAITK